MNKIRTLLTIFLICVSGLKTGITGAATNEHQKLSHIIAEIDDVKKKLKKHKVQQSTVQESLHKTTAAIHELKNKLQKTAKKMQDKQQNLLSLNQKHCGLIEQISLQKQLLAKQIKACYTLDKQKNMLKTLLNHEDPDKTNRLLMYSKFLNEQRLHTIQKLNQNLASLTQNKMTIENETKKLNQLQTEQKQTEQLLLAQKQTKSQILKTINTQLATNTQKLAVLINNKKQLEKKISELTKLAPTKNYLTHHTGKFPWPAHGKILERFGTPIANSQLKQTGMLISPQANQSIIAVAPGKVIFANSMSGYGLLLIIAHGNGYMTLYGNNHALYKKVNDTVKAGEVIGRLGNKTSDKTNALYFGLRKNGKPLDPCQWCGSI